MRYIHGIFFLFWIVLVNCQDIPDTTSLEMMQQLVIEDPSSSQSNYNLGTFYLNNGNLAEARFYLERARILDPIDADIRLNLNILKDKLGSDIVTIPDFFILEWWLNLSSLFNLGTWYLLHLISLIVFLITTFFILVKRHASQNVRLKKIAFSTFIISLALMLAGTSRQKSIYKNQLAVVMGTSPFYTSEVRNSKILQELSPGILIKKLNEKGDMCKIELEDKQVGYVECGVLKSIKFEVN